ncbi:MAG: hypothetical protein GY814_15945 [Gammaproteobacteria bacterium]|nr:hypothetical protein [Gammaproteobacteria bacterium]
MTDEPVKNSFDPGDVTQIASIWRKEWSDRSRSEMLASKGPGFFLWRSVSEGLKSSGVFYTRDMTSDVIDDEGLASSTKELIDQIDHEKSVVVLLGFEEQGQAIVVTVDKLNPPREQKWFEMRDIRRRSVMNAVWVPIRASQRIVLEGKHGREGFLEEYFGLGSVMFPFECHEQVVKLGWTDIGISNNYRGGQVTQYIQPGEDLESRRLFNLRIPGTKTRIQAQIDVPSNSTRENTVYYPCGDYSDYRSSAVGTGLVIDQSINSKEQDVWHLHQDFVVALNLLREGDVWLRPDEGYIEVARLTRDEEGSPELLEIRGEQLRDYLRARKMSLYLSSYRSRVEICGDNSHIDWDPIPYREETELERWEGRASEIHEGGTPFGAKTAVMHVARTDVDDEEDVPTFDFPTDDNVQTSSWTKEDEGRKLYRIEGEVWRTEVIEAGSVSERILWQKPQASIEFIVDAAGKKETRETLEHGSRWLWFRPEAIMSILRQRGSSLKWYSRYTGRIAMVPGEGVHFGVNPLGLINVYAKDIAILPEWQQRVWAGFNIAPDGKVAKELLDSQMRAKPANTQAPEAYLRRAYDAVNGEFSQKAGRRLFRAHQADETLFLAIHRFRALDRDGLFELAKDIARLTIESVDKNCLAKFIEPGKGESWGSIRHLEETLATMIDAHEARQLTGVLAGINELRQADAHMPSSDLDDSIKLAGISETGIVVHEAQQMLRELVDSLYKIATALRDA